MESIQVWRPVRVAIPDSDLKDLQSNLVRSHACGIGDEMPQRGSWNDGNPC